MTPPPISCRNCGCTDANCLQCMLKTGAPCHWVAPDLCSACANAPKRCPAGCGHFLPVGGHFCKTCWAKIPGSLKKIIQRRSLLGGVDAYSLALTYTAVSCVKFVDDHHAVPGETAIFRVLSQNEKNFHAAIERRQKKEPLVDSTTTAPAPPLED